MTAIPTATHGEEVSDLDVLRNLMRETAHRITALEGDSLAEMCERWGVEPPATDEHWAPGELEPVTMAEFLGDCEDAGEIALMCGSQGLRVYSLVESQAIGGHTFPELDPTVERGSTGTTLYGGVLYVDDSPRMQPYLARGYSGALGEYHRALTEPLVYKSLQSIREFLVNGSWSLDVPTDVDDADRERVEEACAAWWKALRTMDGGWEHYVNEAATAAVFGFSIFEIVWRDPVDGRHLPRKIALREPDTVERWLMDHRMDRLVGVHFNTSGDGSRTYRLPATGARLTDHRVLLNRVGGQGNNWEGMPPTRPINALIAKKKLLLTIEAATAERFGAPVLTVVPDKDLLGLVPGRGIDQKEAAEFFRAILYMQAQDTPAMRLPYGLTLAYVGPGGTIPEFRDQLEYIDSQIMLAFSNQGALLGQQSVHGSYALAEVQDNDLLRSAPYYARSITRSLNELIKRSMRDEWGLDLADHPKVVWRMPGVQDASRQIDDMIKFFAAIDTLPPAAQAKGLEVLGLPPDTMEATDAAEDQEQSAEAGKLEGEP